MSVPRGRASEYRRLTLSDMTRISAAVVALALACAPAQGQTRRAPTVPTLVVLLTIDQLLPDYLDAWQSEFRGGLGRLLKGGAVYPNGFQDHGVTETAPGHASILSGRFPRSTGVVGNAAGVFDPEAPLIGARGDPASPYRFRGSTLADWLRFKNARARAVSVSRKDRSAILPLGRAKGEAYWYASGGMFTTSTYYADTLPGWLKAFNARGLTQSYAGTSWSLLRDAAQYNEPDSVAFESGGADFTFPHMLPADPVVASRVLPNYPMMDQVTLQLALAALSARELGAEEGRTDLLAISLSSTDAIGHKYGPDSREVHDQLLRLDEYLGSFLDSLYKVRDSSRVVLVLTSDHGVAPYPFAGFKTRFRSVEAGFVELRPLASDTWARVITAGVDTAAFSWEGESLYLDPEAFRRAGVNRDSVAREYARAARTVPGVLRVDVFSELQRKDVSNDPIGRRWLNMFPEDLPIAVVTTLKPYWYWAGIAQASHGSPHDYDARVPIIFAGAGVKPGRHSDVVRVVDIAPTLVAILQVRALEKLDGKVLTDVIR